MTRASNERLSLASADTDAVQATFSGFSFPLDAGNRGREWREKDEGEKEKQGRKRTTECEGRVMFSPGHVAIFPFGKGRGTTTVATSRLSCSRGSNVRNISPWK